MLTALMSVGSGLGIGDLLRSLEVIPNERLLDCSDQLQLMRVTCSSIAYRGSLQTSIIWLLLTFPSVCREDFMLNVPDRCCLRTIYDGTGQVKGI